MNISEFPKDLAVITTRFVIHEKSPITSVYLDDEGDLQMLGDEEVQVEDAMVVSLGSMLELDNTLLTLPPLEYGNHFVRVEVGAHWHLLDDEDE